MLQAIVFDFDGVIADTEPLHWRAFIDVLEPLGISFDYETYLREYIGFDDRDAFRYDSANHDLDLHNGRLEEMVERKAAAFARIVGEGIAPFPGSVELIRSTAAAWPIAIASGALRADIDLILPAIGDGTLPSLFGAIVTADNVTKSKPDPETYTLAAQRLGVNPRHCLAIEDTPTGLESARAAGLRTLAVAHSYPVSRLEGVAERVVTKFTGVTAEQLNDWYR